MAGWKGAPRHCTSPLRKELYRPSRNSPPCCTPDYSDRCCSIPTALYLCWCAYSQIRESRPVDLRNFRQALIELKAEVDPVADDGATPLWIAAHEGPRD